MNEKRARNSDQNRQIFEDVGVGLQCNQKDEALGALSENRRGQERGGGKPRQTSGHPARVEKHRRPQSEDVDDDEGRSRALLEIGRRRTDCHGGRNASCREEDWKFPKRRANRVKECRHQNQRVVQVLFLVWEKVEGVRVQPKPKPAGSEEPTDDPLHVFFLLFV